MLAPAPAATVEAPHPFWRHVKPPPDASTKRTAARGPESLRADTLFTAPDDQRRDAQRLGRGKIVLDNAFKGFGAERTSARQWSDAC